MANRFFIVGGVDTNWGTVGNWSLTSGGAGGQAVPTAADDVTIDASSGSACVLNTSARVCASFTSSAFTGTVTFDQQLSVSGSITIGAAQAFAGPTTNRLRMIATGTIDSNAVTIPQDFEIGGSTSFTATLADALTLSGTLYLTNTTSTTFAGAFALTAAACVISGTQTVTVVDTFSVTGQTTISDATVLNGSALTTGGLMTVGNLTGTTAIIFGGSGSWIGAAGYLTNDVQISTGDILDISGIVQYRTGTLELITGVVSADGSTLSLGASATLDTEGMSWFNISITDDATITLNSELVATGTLTIAESLEVAFAGTSGFDVGTVANTGTVGTRVVTFLSGIQYIVRSLPAAIYAGAQAVRLTLTASGGNVIAVFQRGAG